MDKDVEQPTSVADGDTLDEDLAALVEDNDNSSATALALLLAMLAFVTAVGAVILRHLFFHA
ncbi:MAG TPA: hypothetical protein VFE42_16020 [Chloroflexota bacterium]|nr:hypothetical protein [Chloroflexota bacterium]